MITGGRYILSWRVYYIDPPQLLSVILLASGMYQTRKMT